MGTSSLSQWSAYSLDTTWKWSISLTLQNQFIMYLQMYGSIIFLMPSVKLTVCIKMCCFYNFVAQLEARQITSSLNLTVGLCYITVMQGTGFLCSLLSPSCRTICSIPCVSQSCYKCRKWRTSGSHHNNSLWKAVIYTMYNCTHYICHVLSVMSNCSYCFIKLY